MYTRRQILTFVGGASLTLAGCTATTESSPQNSADKPPEPYPMVAFDKHDNDTVYVSLDVLDDADYVRIDTDTTNQTAILEEEGDDETFTNLDGGNLTVTAVIETNGETYEYTSHGYDASYVPPTSEVATPTDEPTVEFVEKQSEDGLTVEIQCRGLGDADYVLVETSRDDDHPQQLANYGESAHFRNLQSGDELIAIAVTDGNETVIDTYTVE